MSARPDPASWFDTISDILRRLADLQETGFITDITDAEWRCHYTPLFVCGHIPFDIEYPTVAKVITN